MKEARTKILIIILALYVVFDPSIKKIEHGKEYLHSLFNESFDDETSASAKEAVPISIGSLQNNNEVVDLLRK
jgi:hypothetical protein